ncbi:MAG: GNAT family N-acetyltransferase [Candidatus Freyarchaeota archaeon]
MSSKVLRGVGILISVGGALAVRRMVVQEFQEQDAEVLAEIFMEAFRDEVARGMEVITAENFIAHSKRKDVKIFVAEWDGRVVGYAVVSKGDGLPVQVHMIAVKQEFRGRGMGKRLMERVVDYARSIGKKKTSLFTRPWNKAMRKICLDLGFVPEAYLRKEFFNEDLIQYSMFLESPDM